MNSESAPLSQRTTLNSGLRVLALIAIPLLALLILPIGRLRGHHLHLKSCLQKADELREGAPVQISGVELGIGHYPLVC